MLTIEDFRNQNKDLTPYTDGQVDYLRMVYDVIRFPWKCFKAGNVEIQKHPVPFGDVFTLLIDNQCYMTTSFPDLIDHACLFIEASCSVLLTGFGLGIGVLLCDANDNVSSITVVENNPIVIQHIAPMVIDVCHRVTPVVIEHDANTWPPNQLFDFGFIDHGHQKVEHERYNAHCRRVISWWNERQELEKTWR